MVSVPEHRADIDAGCPLSGFAGDARRLDDESRVAYAGGVAAYLDQIAAVLEARGEKDSRAKAIVLFCERLGTLVLSHAVADVAPALADEILGEGREHLLGAAAAQNGKHGGETRSGALARKVIPQPLSRRTVGFETEPKPARNSFYRRLHI